ncbi:MAG TPA: hypothetical protein VLG76_04275 [Rhabdochlamydiaceae bacterium]|nr:hypothetical protein [Rhabdochlamydiaceae bacterium]
MFKTCALPKNVTFFRHVETKVPDSQTPNQSFYSLVNHISELEATGELTVKSKRKEVAVLTHELVKLADLYLNENDKEKVPYFVSRSSLETALKILWTQNKKLSFVREDIEHLDRLAIQMKWQMRFPVASNPKKEFLCSSNQKLAEKWVQVGLDNELLACNPDCAKKIIELRLHNPIHAWKGILYADKNSRQLEVLAEGTRQRALPFFNGLKIHWIEWKSKANSQENWCCTSKGFVKRRSCEWKNLESCSQLNSEQLKRARELSSRLLSPNAKGDANCVLEILSAWNPGRRNFFITGIFDVYRSPQHPWARLIDKNGNIHSVGFHPSKIINLFNLHQMAEGQFRSPDTFEGVNHLCKISTKIGISEQQFNELKSLIERYQYEKRKFNYLKPNCTSFMTDILHRVGFQVQTNMPASEFAFRCVPLAVQPLFYPIFIPLRKICGILHRCLIYPFSREPEKEQFLGSIPGKWVFQIPRKMVEWQMLQPTTRVFAKGTPFVEQY